MKRLLTILVLTTITYFKLSAQTANDSIQVNKPMRHEFVKRGNHQKELKLGDYVIAGVFRSETNAIHYTDELRKAGYPEAAYGYASANNNWYIHLAVSNDIETVKAERDKYRKFKMFKDAWLLTVHQ